jgi:uncharacterized protein (DUF433 family)
MTEHIVRDGETGRALVSSTGTPVDEILQAFQDGAQFEAVLARHPELTPEAIAAALRFARNAVGREFRYVPDPTFGQYEVREEPIHPFNGGYAPGGIAEAEPGFDDGDRLPYEEGFAGARARGSSGRGDDVGSIDVALRSAADARERLLYELEVVESVHAGLEDVAAGRVVSHEEAVAFLRATIPG